MPQDSLESPVDLAHLRLYTAGDAALEREIVVLFAESCSTYLAGLAEEAEAKVWREAAHGLKGAARGVGAFALGQLAETAESLSGATSAQRAAIRQAIAAEMTRAMDFLSKLAP
jgi:HPt (histidine-containing phosphotransfer) domain-containing protein